MKRIFMVFFVLFLALSLLSSCAPDTNTGFNIVATNFPSYDFAKNIVGDRGNVYLLLPPGGESHTYEPTAKDIIKISEADIFIYTGGESDAWIETVLSTIPKKPLTIKMMDFVEICQDVHSHKDHTHSVDEHIWTSLKFSKDIICGISREISALDEDNSSYYQENADKYLKEIQELDKDFEELFLNAKRKTIVVADRFPFTHFANDYGLKYYSAYHSCSEDAEPTPHIIAELIDAVRHENIPIVFHLEFSNKLISSAVSEDTGVKTAMLHSCHKSYITFSPF